MAVDISLLGATYPAVPAVVLPKSGGGYATFYEEGEALNMFYPVGAIYMSTSSTAPNFGGTWQEIVMPATWGDIEDGNRSYVSGTGTGTVHFWKRIS